MKRLMIGTVGTSLLALVFGLVLVWPAAAQDRDSMSKHGQHLGQADGPAITVEQARTQATEFLSKLDASNLTIGEVLPFYSGFYVSVLDSTTGTGAFELLVNLDGTLVHPETGPTMMWNTEYSPMLGTKGNLLHSAMATDMTDMTDMNMMEGMSSNGMNDAMMGGMSSNDMMGGMSDNDMMSGMGGQGQMDNHGIMDQDMMGSATSGHGDRPATSGYQAGSTQPLNQPLTTDAAVALGQSWLTEQIPNATATSPIAFPGYVTVKIERSGRIIGLVSVQTSTGAIWQHVWHSVAS